MSGKLYTLNTRLLSKEMLHIHNEFYNELMNGVHPELSNLQELTNLVPFTIKVAREFIVLMVQQTVESFLAYRKYPDANIAMINLLCGNKAAFNKSENIALAILQLKESYESVLVDIENQIGNFLTRNTWHDVEIIDAEFSVSVIVSGDRRIREWEESNGAETEDKAMRLVLSDKIDYLRSRFDRHFKPVTINIPCDRHTGNVLDKRFILKYLEQQPDLRLVNVNGNTIGVLDATPQFLEFIPDLVEHNKFTSRVIEGIVYQQVVAPLSSLLNIHDMILNRIYYKYPNLIPKDVFYTETGSSLGKGLTGTNLNILENAQISEYCKELYPEMTSDIDTFFNYIVDPIIVSMGFNNIVRKLDDDSKYNTYFIGDVFIAEILEEVIYDLKKFKDLELRDLVESYKAGDHLPEEDRIRAEKWILENEV